MYWKIYINQIAYTVHCLGEFLIDDEKKILSQQQAVLNRCMRDLPVTNDAKTDKLL